MAPTDHPGLHRIIYLSSAVGVLPAHELDRILLRAQVSNQSLGITGLLLFHEGNFLQCLEGPAAGVLSLMERVRRNRRHTGVMVLESTPCATRAFPGWSMGYVAGRNLSVGQKAGFVDLMAAASRRTPGGASVCASAADRLWSFLSTFQQTEAA